MRVILVPVADRPECVHALDTAFGLAERLNANVVGCHVRPHREERHAARGPLLPLTLDEGAWPELPPQTVKLNRDNARRMFREMARMRDVAIARKPRLEERPLAYWEEMVGTPEKVLGIVGPLADLLVLSRPRARSSGIGRAFVLAALLNSGKPLLVLPQKRVTLPGKRILIAWDQRELAAIAVTAALPLLRLAEQVHIVRCGREAIPGPKATHLRNYLLHWGIEAEVHHAPGRNPAEEILGAYGDTRSNLVVMGAYSRGRLRERILGGVTHELLMNMDVPVFALHS
ncbi:MAG: universal stress protein [Lysobacterales bacterium]